MGTNAARSGAAPQPSVRQTAYEGFRRALLDRRLRPGQLVSQRELMALLDLSIGALRELLPRLETEGLLKVLPQRGIQITQIDLPMIRDAFQFRLAMEREAVLHAVEHMPDAEIAAQRAAHAEVLARLGAGPGGLDVDHAQTIDDGFHTSLIEATGNGLMIQAHAVNAIRIKLIRLDRTTLSVKTLPGTFDDHLAIIDAIAARDAAAAVTAMQRHIVNARQRALSL